MYILIDYLTGKELEGHLYQHQDEAIRGKNAYLKQMIIDKKIHNNLIIVKEIENITK